MKLICLLAGLSLVAICGSLSANDTPSGHRVALLLGNSQYEGFTLPGVQGSLKQVEDSLTRHGFRVTRRENLAEKDQEAAVEEFAKSVPTNGVALVYYIGLGAHVERFDKTYNLLRPVGEQIASDNDYRSRGLDVAELIKKLREGSGARVNLIFLDACWDSPIRPEKGQVFGGLHEFEVGPDTLVMFAAGSRQTLPAPEGNAPSAFSQSLVKNLARLDVSVEAACEAIAANVGKTITPKPWCADTTGFGIGTRADLPLADALRDGKAPTRMPNVVEISARSRVRIGYWEARPN
jgi:hypothetical protein